MGEKGVYGINKELIEKNRAHNFQLGDSNQIPNTTVSRATYDYKGNPMTIRQTLDENQKSDLKAHHFQMGSHPRDFTTKNQKPETLTGTHSQTHFEGKPLLKNSGQRIFGGQSNLKALGSPSKGGGDYKTTNQSFIKWIQPQP